MNRPLILLTNDDGIDSPGLIASAVALAPLGELLVAAPASQQTSLSRAFPKIPNLGAIEPRTLRLGQLEQSAFAIHGSPAYCVSYAILELASRSPSLCVSGINYGENLGLSLMPSGTVGAAFEADSYGIPAIAASLEVPASQHHSDDFQEQNWHASIHFLRNLAERILAKPRAPSVAVWNLNVPADATLATPCRVTRQSRQNYFIFTKPARVALNLPTKLPVSIEIDLNTLEPDSDIRCTIVDRCVSLTPLTWDMTASVLPVDSLALLQ